jgi:hypothetical protein
MNKTCGGCGVAMPAEDNFCWHCGRRIDGVSALVPYSTAIAQQAYYASPVRTIVDAAKGFLGLFAPKDSEFVKLAVNRIQRSPVMQNISILESNGKVTTTNVINGKVLQ